MGLSKSKQAKKKPSKNKKDKKSKEKSKEPKEESKEDSIEEFTNSPIEKVDRPQKFEEPYYIRYRRHYFTPLVPVNSEENVLYLDKDNRVDLWLDPTGIKEFFPEKYQQVPAGIYRPPCCRCFTGTNQRIIDLKFVQDVNFEIKKTECGCGGKKMNGRNIHPNLEVADVNGSKRLLVKYKGIAKFVVVFKK